MENGSHGHPLPCSKMMKEVLWIGTSCVDCVSDEFSDMPQTEIVPGLWTQL